MKGLVFSKYQGTGNDFIMIDDRELKFTGGKEEIATLCHRRFGIGADGLILLQNHPEYDFRMVYFNSDGRESSMCGNGGRCIAAFAAELAIVSMGSTMRFEAADGYHEAILISHADSAYQVDLRMKDVLEVETTGEAVILNTGSPHYVRACWDLDILDIVTEAHSIRYSGPFTENGINVNFIQESGDDIRIRTYERGVEDETFSCGTGVVAAAIASHFIFPSNPVRKILTKGGELSVSFEHVSGQGFFNIHLVGPAIKVFEGQL